MGTEIISLIYLPGLAAFLWLCHKSIFAALPGRAVYFVALLVGLSLGVRGMVNAYLPTIPENWNFSFLSGWFLINASFWLIVTGLGAKLAVAILGSVTGKRSSSDAM